MQTCTLSDCKLCNPAIKPEMITSYLLKQLLLLCRRVGVAQLALFGRRVYIV